MKKRSSLFAVLLTSILLGIILIALVDLGAMEKINYAPYGIASGIHDVAIKSVSVSKRNVVRGELVYIYVTAENQGDYSETFEVTTYANSKPVSMPPQSVNDLPAKATRDLTFTWNTAAWLEGTNTIKAQANTVLGEVDILDNALTDGTVSLRLTATVGSSGFYLSTDLAFQRKAFHAAGLHWVFYSDYRNMVYTTSSDGIVWSSPTIVREALYGYLFSIWFDGTYVHYAYRDPAGIFHRRGSINVGTITWGSEHIVVNGNFWAPNMCVDTNGFPWISYRTNQIGPPPHTKPYIARAMTTDGSSWGTPHELSSLDRLWWAVPTPLTSGKVYVLYSYQQGSIYGNLWNGNTWLTTPETATAVGSATAAFGSFSSVSERDNVYVVYLQDFTRNIVTLNRTNGVWGQEAKLVTSDGGPIIPGIPDPLPTISVDSANGNLYVRWINAELHQIRYDATAREWGNVETPFGTIFISAYPRSLSSYYQVMDSLVGSTWTEGTGSPYCVVYAS